MGAKDSKRACLPYEDAVKRMSDEEFKRVCEAFKRLGGGGQLLSKQTFIQNVLGDGVPPAISEWLFTACGGGARGIALKDLLCGLVLLTKGKQEEKVRFLWTLYCNDAGTCIVKSDFCKALQIEGSIPPERPHNSLQWERTLFSLFPNGQDKVTYEFFSQWIQCNKEATVLSKWLLSNPCVSLSSELEAPTFYQTLAGVTHLEEQDICELEKCFWTLQSTSPSGHLDLHSVRAMVCPPIPVSACEGLFLALDVNRDGHVDFKELCCGISAACRGPTAERIKFCFKIFDRDRDCYLDSGELHHMVQTLLFVANESTQKRLDSGTFSDEETTTESAPKILDALHRRLDDRGGLSQEEFLVWGVKDRDLVEPMLELLFQVCHVSFVLRPHCRHHEHDIVHGWLQREERRGYHVGQFWYLVSSDWWQNWLGYVTAPRTGLDHCNCNYITQRELLSTHVEEGIMCDESLTDYTSSDFNGMESMGDLLSNKTDTCSIASSSGVSSSSGGGKRNPSMPGHIDNSNLVEQSPTKLGTLTGEGGRLKRDMPLVQHRDFELVPDSLWKALAHWYGGPLPLPRQVILPPGSSEVELELYPVNLSIWRHHHQMGQTGGASQASWSSVVGGYGAAALSTAGITTTPAVAAAPRRYLAHTAAFSRLANVRQVTEFLCSRLALRIEDCRLWHLKDATCTLLLEDENAILQDLGVTDGDKILLEVRNKDLTWPEELGALAAAGGQMSLSPERRATISLPPGATGLHNLGNTCFMNAALQAVSNTRPLTLYFQRDGQLCELNSVNPLGTKGMVARRYAELCRDLWAGSTRSVAPLKLRYCVTKHAPHLGGGGQHDSQELLAWLLDALHEDLNRVAHKQYTELKDSGGRPDEVVADEAWIQHLARDHSIITDLFYGQLKSKVKCETCGHESVRFDPFNLLSLPLPMESYTLCEVLVVRLHGDTPIKYGLRLNSEAKYVELKQQLQNMCHVESDRLLLAELAYSQIRQIFNDDSRINPNTASELYAYELPDNGGEELASGAPTDTEQLACFSESPLARSPEVRGGSALCMPNILCFKNKNQSSHRGGTSTFVQQQQAVRSRTGSLSSNKNLDSDISTNSSRTKFPTYLVAFHRKSVRQETYFLSQQKSKPSLFGSPILLNCSPQSTCQSLYESAWGQVTRLLSPLPQSDQTNHATDCDDSLGYEFPFQLKSVLQGGQICAICHWTKFCRGCVIPCSSDVLLVDYCKASLAVMCVAIDWDPTALHLRYQSSREKLFVEDASVSQCRKLHTEPIDLDYCLRAFTSEERLEAKYHCSNCQDKQPATKKLQIWRLPPILIIHLKRFDYVNSKWVKTQKVVNFPFTDFNPTAYLASVPQETILRHLHLKETGSSSVVSTIDEIHEVENVSNPNENSKLLNNNVPKNNSRARLQSTSLTKTPIIDEHLKDYHQHKLLPGQDVFDLRYQLYAVVSHSGMLNGGHYISYACNPNGNWYCYNDSSCREVLTEDTFPKTCCNVKPAAAACNSLPRRSEMSKSPAVKNSLEDVTVPEIDEVACSLDNGQTNRPEEDNNVISCSRCAYGDVKVPKIDTSSAYILFYERSGLDYKPYLPDVVSNGQTVPEVELDENESELRKQLCSIQ